MSLTLLANRLLNYYAYHCVAFSVYNPKKKTELLDALEITLVSSTRDSLFVRRLPLPRSRQPLGQNYF